MTNTAAHLVDRVLPNVPIRQWVLSLPFDLRALAARTPAAISAIDRILFREIERWMQRSAGPRQGRAGAITFVQRFGGSLNLHVHFHVLVLEGLFTRDSTSDGDALPVFHPALAPTCADLLDVLGRVRAAVIRWVERKLPAASPADLPDDGGDALTACAHAAIQPGLFDRLSTDGAANQASDHDADEPPGLGRSSVALHGFNLHAAVRVGADDDVARERLVRYCARPPFALERLSVLPDGRIAYRIKQARNNATHRILSPIELLARIAALVPPPRHPFLRYHGVLAPSSKWRSHIVPREPVADSAADAHSATHADSAAHATHATHAAHTQAHPIRDEAPLSSATRAPDARASASSLRPTPPSALPVPHARPPTASSGMDGTHPRTDTTRRTRAPFAVLAPAHRARLALGDGDLLARTHRVEWSKLLRRTFAADVLECPRCRGRARIVAAIQDPAEAARFVAAIHERSIPTPSGAVAPDDDDDSQLPPPSSRRPAARPPPDD